MGNIVLLVLYTLLIARGLMISVTPPPFSPASWRSP